MIIDDHKILGINERKLRIVAKNTHTTTTTTSTKYVTQLWSMKNKYNLQVWDIKSVYLKMNPRWKLIWWIKRKKFKSKQQQQQQQNTWGINKNNEKTKIKTPKNLIL